MADTDKDFQDLTRMASRVARSRDLSVDQILPKLIELFDDLKELDIPTKLEIMQRAPTGPMIRRPPSWVLGDDAFDPRDSVVILTVRSPLRTMDSFALSCCDIPSDLSASTSDKSDGGSVMKRLPKIPSPTYDKGQVFSRQEQRSCVVTVVGGPGRPETEILSSSASSRITALGNSSDRLDSTAGLENTLVQQKPKAASRHSLSVSIAQGGATTTAALQRSSPPPVTGRTSGQLSLKQRTNQEDSAVGVTGTRSARSSETAVNRIDPMEDGACQPANQTRIK
ncbi:hypothetical protein B0J12DRAFT_246557 [Macrophomina phaseolina]|uniref:Uncharacterized protein n=1 Tax=Macrophomina phaseolina TaxID=35725 RepID=A0ABQ8G0C7_9PEZI|nr:hypothetical protein B0J12DRAFT_246557 [Macrophomina phaseolina]